MGKGLNSRAKGNRFELEVAKKLTAVWGFKLVRTPNSGAFKNLAPADIIPEDRQTWVDFPFHLELKNRNGWALEHLLSKKKQSDILKWWFEEEAKQVSAVGDKFYDKCMLLIFTKNHDDTYVMLRVPRLTWNCQDQLGPKLFYPLSWWDLAQQSAKNKSYLDFSYAKPGTTETCNFQIFQLDDFLSWFDFKTCVGNYKLWLINKTIGWAGVFQPVNTDRAIIETTDTTNQDIIVVPNVPKLKKEPEEDLNNDKSQI